MGFCELGEDIGPAERSGVDHVGPETDAVRFAVAVAEARGWDELDPLEFEDYVEDRLDVNRVPVQIDPSSVAYLQNAFYVDHPSRLFQGLLAETLRVSTGRLVIAGADPGLPNRTRLYGRLVEMGYDVPSMSVTVTYDAVRVDPEGNINAQRFSHSVPGIAADSIYVAPALNDAANEVAASVAEWMNGFTQ